jgi:hypothetical protein
METLEEEEVKKEKQEWGNWNQRPMKEERRWRENMTELLIEE